jgi:hypothetical protein
MLPADGKHPFGGKLWKHATSLYVCGEKVATVPEDQIVSAVVEQVRKIVGR